MISIIAPSRGRPEKSEITMTKWCYLATDAKNFQFVVSVDANDPKLSKYKEIYGDYALLISKNRSCVDAINNAAEWRARGDIFVVVSDDTDCFAGWDTALLKELEGKSDYVLKTDDGIQDYIVTMTVCDRVYFEREGYIYHPDFDHQFADTYLTCKADIRGKLIRSKLKFPHLHYSTQKEQPDALHKRNDATWKQGEELFIKLMKEFSTSDLAKITDISMRNWLRNKGVR